MENKLADKNEFQNMIKIINRNAKKLIQLTNDILDVTKIETRNMKLNKEVFNLMDLIFDIIQDYKDQLKDKNVKLTYKFLYYNQPDNIKKERSIVKENSINGTKGK